MGLQKKKDQRKREKEKKKRRKRKQQMKNQRPFLVLMSTNVLNLQICVQQANTAPTPKDLTSVNHGHVVLCAHVVTDQPTDTAKCIPGAIMRAPFIRQDIDECASGAICLGMYEQCINTIGHYRCQCARFFRRDPNTGQCQPDPAIYSRYLPTQPRRTPLVEEETKKEEEKATEEVKAAEEEKKEEEKN